MDASASVKNRISLRLFAWFLPALLGSGCAGHSPDEPFDSNVQSEAEAAVDGTVDAVSITNPLAFQAIAPCLAESDYVRSTVVFVRGSTCSPRCVRLAAGGTVTFVGMLPNQSVEPRSVGTTPSPITQAAFGGSAEFEFSDYGFFPFQCGPATDATGVVWSTFW
jgi:hypothetical protein